jgi:hypothetical protein
MLLAHVLSKRLAEGWLDVQLEFFATDRALFRVGLGNEMGTDARFVHAKSLARNKAVTHATGWPAIKILPSASK